jgi:hypothetical protein
MEDVSLSEGKAGEYRYWPRWTGRLEKFCWPRIVDRDSARRAAAQGAAIAGFQAIVGLWLVLWNTFYPSNKIFPEFNLWNLLDVAVCILLAWLIYWRLSRVAAVLGLAYYIGSQVVAYSDHPEMHADARLVLYSLMYVNGIRGAFAYWKQPSEEPKSPIASTSPS